MTEILEKGFQWKNAAGYCTLTRLGRRYVENQENIEQFREFYSTALGDWH